MKQFNPGIDQIIFNHLKVKGIYSWTKLGIIFSYEKENKG
jgi:hypothetical protein